MTDRPHMDERVDEALSPVGRRRRDAMLIEAQREMARLHRGRRRRRIAARWTAAIGLALAGTWFIHHALRNADPVSTVATGDHEAPPLTQSTRDRDGMPSNADDAIEPASNVRMIASTPVRRSVIVRTDAAVLDRAVMPGQSDIRTEWLDDNTLLDLLASLGRPSGLIRIGDEVQLTADVADRPGESRF